jgi:hypothetical protein
MSTLIVTVSLEWDFDDATYGRMAECSSIGSRLVGGDRIELWTSCL